MRAPKSGRRLHGYSKTPMYVAWKAMKQRCFNVNHAHYHWYGARGIQVCARWFRFENFLSDMGPRPNGMSVERVNNDWSYMPSNCKWATAHEQALNRRNQGARR